jgi:hypothetical protein
MEHGRPRRVVDLVEGSDHRGEGDAPAVRGPAGINVERAEVDAAQVEGALAAAVGADDVDLGAAIGQVALEHHAGAIR